jgi:hypothetical protein
MKFSLVMIPSEERIYYQHNGRPQGYLSGQKAIWVNQDTILWVVIGSSRYQYALATLRTAAPRLPQI